ncbi:hypothetical protein [Pseudoruegeria sp. HB172150]|uniref:hypothetical protein n=1 Tax=Pseudoruegeria sp. HB172150 TaxID=2721164 RepID=UPI0015578F57|nr:hypothetical protein [Pseudoruegeria sp. HB172150]
MQNDLAHVGRRKNRSTAGSGRRIERMVATLANAGGPCGPDGPRNKWVFEVLLDLSRYARGEGLVRFEHDLEETAERLLTELLAGCGGRMAGN